MRGKFEFMSGNIFTP